MSELNPIAGADVQQQVAAQSSANQPPSSAVAKVAPPKKPTGAAAAPNLRQVNATMAVTLDLTKAGMFEGVNAKKALSSIKLGESEEMHNIYNMFAGKTKKNPDGVRGLLRQAMGQVIGFIETLNGRDLLLLGKPSEAMSYVKRLADETASAINGALSVQQSEVVFALEADGETDGSETKQVTLGEMLHTDAYIVAPADDTAVMDAFQLVFAVRVVSPHVFDTEDKMKAVANIASMLERLVVGDDGNEPLATGLLFNIALDAQDLENPAMLELVQLLQEQLGFVLFSKNAMLEGRVVFDLAPPSKAQIENVLFPAGSDLLLVLGINLDDGEEEAEAEEEAEEAEAEDDDDEEGSED